MKLPKWSKRLTFNRYLIRKSGNTCKLSVPLLLRSGPWRLPTRGTENHIPATAGQPGMLACKLAFFFFNSKRVFYHLKWSKFKAEKAGHREGGRGKERRKKGSMHSSQSGRMRIYCGYTWNISDLSYNFCSYGPCCPRENTTWKCFLFVSGSMSPLTCREKPQVLRRTLGLPVHFPRALSKSAE